MTLWVVLPLLLSALFGLLAPLAFGQLPPAIGTWLLSGGAVLGAGASCASLGLLAFVYLAQLPEAAEHGRWSIGTLRSSAHLPAWLGVLACIAVAALGARFVRALVHRASALHRAHLLAAGFAGADDELVVIDAVVRHALAVPGRPGRVVVTSGMLRSLDAPQRRALLAHERAHLAHRHHWHQTAAALAAAVNPLLWRVRAAVGRSCERWADEAAAARCPRTAIAAALTRAALGASLATAVSAVVLAAAVGDVAARIRALEAPAPRVDRRRGLLLVGGAVLLAAIAVAVAIAMHDVERLFEHAQSLYRPAATRS